MRPLFLVASIVFILAGVGTSWAAEPLAAGLASLTEAIQAFNAKASTSPIGKNQPLLTQDEVIAAIRMAERKDYPSASDHLFRAFKRIAQTRKLPANAEFEVLTWLDPGADFLYDTWYVRILLRKDDGGTYSFPIRSRVIRSRPVGEVARELEKSLRETPPLPGRYRLEEKVRELKARAQAAKSGAAKSGAESKENLKN